jgi:hypothetical protein
VGVPSPTGGRARRRPQAGTATPNGLILLAGERFRSRASLAAEKQIAAEREYALEGAGWAHARSYPGEARYAAPRESGHAARGEGWRAASPAARATFTAALMSRSSHAPQAGALAANW